MPRSASPFSFHLNPRANGVPIAGWRVEEECDEVPAVLFRVSQKAQLRSAAVENPEVKITVEIPIGQRHGPGIVKEIKARRPRDVRKARARFAGQTKI